mmetsp:Transcript_18204/g.42677  ORF Transcript_18204/g.42677 Transcript_18204/m.42677 type:complete len:214 (+) Transcript_18204:61-702(+)
MREIWKLRRLWLWLHRLWLRHELCQGRRGEGPGPWHVTRQGLEVERGTPQGQQGCQGRRERYAREAREGGGSSAPRQGRGLRGDSGGAERKCCAAASVFRRARQAASSRAARLRRTGPAKSRLADGPPVHHEQDSPGREKLAGLLGHAAEEVRCRRRAPGPAGATGGKEGLWLCIHGLYHSGEVATVWSGGFCGRGDPRQLGLPGKRLRRRRR